MKNHLGSFPRRLLSAGVAGVLAVAALVAATAQPAQALGTTYYVSNAPGSGCSDSVAVPTASQPWCSASKVNGVRSPGDRILIGRGSSWDNQMLEFAGSGTAGSPITIAAYGSGLKPKLSLKALGRNDAATFAVIRLKNPSFWNVSGLELSYAGAGVIAQYRAEFPGSAIGNSGLRFSDMVVHHIAGIRQGVPNGDGSIFSEKCQGIATSGPHHQNLDLWQSGGIAVTGDYNIAVPANSFFVEDIRISDVEGYNNLNVVNIDNCDAQLGHPDTPGAAKPGLVRNVWVDNLWAYDGDGGEFAAQGQCNEGVRFAGVTNLRMTNSRIDNLGACYVTHGTAGVILVSVSDAQIMNNTFTDIPETGSPDQTAIDFEIYVENVEMRNNLIARNAGPGVELLSLRCGIGDYNRDHDFIGNSFFGNASSLHQKVKDCTPRATFSGAVKDNLYSDTDFLDPVNDFSSSSWTLAYNLSTSEDPHYAADEFGPVAGASGWSHQTTEDKTDPTAWSDATYQDDAHFMGEWTGGPNRGRITPFEQVGGSCALCASARVWTAWHDGQVAIRSRAFKSDFGGSAATVVVEKNGVPIVTKVVSSTDIFGQDVNRDYVAVKKGDRLRFVVFNSTPSTTDWVSWAPSIAYLPEPAADSDTGTFAGSGFERNPIGDGTFWYGNGVDLLGMWTYPPSQAAEGGAGIVSNGSLLGNPLAPTDVQAGFIQKQGWVLQRIAGLRTGVPYKVTFKGAKRANFADQSVQVVVDGQVVGTLPMASTVYQSYATPVFTTTEGVHTIEFRGTATADAMAFIDDVSVVEQAPSVPQPPNSSFETPTLSGSDYYQYTPAGSAWNFASHSGVFRNGSPWADQDVPLGQQGAFVQAKGSLATSLPAVPAGDYAVVFSAAQRPGAHALQSLKVQLNGVPVTTITPTSDRWQTYSTPKLTLPAAGPKNIAFFGTATTDLTAVIDDVRLIPVGGTTKASFEEPEVWWHEYGPTDAAPWTFQGELSHGGAGISRNSSAFESNATDGNQVAFLQRASVLTSDPGWLPPGGTYVISLDSVQRTPWLGPANTQELRLEVDGVRVRTWTPQATWQTSSVTISVPPDGTGRITIHGTWTSHDWTAFIDNLRITKIS